MNYLVLTALLFTATASAAHPLDGRIWDTRTRSFVDAGIAYDLAAGRRYVLLGETHDSDIHHRLQLETLQALDKRGFKPALAMEQFDHEHQSALTGKQNAGATDPEQLADAGQLNRKGWRWPMYKDLIAYAAERGWPLLAANLSRTAARDIAMGKVKPELPAADAAQIAAMENEIVQGHCGQSLPQDRLTAIVTAQRARDMRMAETLESAASPVVLIAGTGHIRRDRAVPRYLKDSGSAIAIAYIELEAGKLSPEDYDTGSFDLLWFTLPTERPDPCAKALTGSVATPNSNAN